MNTGIFNCVLEPGCSQALQMKMSGPACRPSDLDLELGIWVFFGIWDLELWDLAD